MRRRNLLKKIGGTATVLTLAAPRAIARDGEVARRIDVDAPGHDDVDGATVTLYEDGRTRVQMTGTRPANPTRAKGYRVLLKGLTGPSGQYTPEQARAEIKALPPGEFLRKNGSGGTENEDFSGSGTSGDSGVGTQGHNGGDSESDYEGGIWVRSEDIVDIDLAYTEGWIDWTTSGGEVDHVQWKYHAVGCDTGCSTWHVDDAGHDYTEFNGDDSATGFHGDFYNYDFGSSDRTDAHHRLYVNANPDGSMNWTTDHWHEGEYGDSLRTDAGWFTNYDEHANHCAQSC